MPLDADDLETIERTIAMNGSLARELAPRTRFSEATTKIVELFDRLNASQRPVLLSLLSRYEIVTSYDDHVWEMAEALSERAQAGESFYITTPHRTPPKSPKSSDLVVYELRSHMNARGFSRNQIDSLSILPTKPCTERTLLIVDDFSGTGNTVVKALDHLESIGQNLEKVHVALIYAMRAACLEISSRGVSTYAVKIGNRALTDHTYSTSEGGSNAPAIYDSVELEIGVAQDYRRGFKGSEALVTMKRTPNNTLPVFWWSGNSWPCPFPR